MVWVIDDECNKGAFPMADRRQKPRLGVRKAGHTHVKGKSMENKHVCPFGLP